MKKPFLKTALCLFLAAGASSLVQAQVIDKTPLLHMSFDNVSGTNVINDGTGGSAMNGTLNGGASIVPGGKFGNALQVSGTASSDASVRINNVVVPFHIEGTNAWSLAMWIQTTTQGGTWAYQGSGAWAVGNTTFAMVVNNGSTGNNGPAAGGVRNSSGWQQGTATVDDGNWHHIVFTYDGTNKVQYIDGAVDPWVANQWNASAATGNQLWIGGGGTGQNDGQVCLNGLIDEAYVFNRALSVSDVQALYGSNNVPHVPITVSLSTNSGYRGTVFTVTATVTPVSGFSVTNSKVDVSSLKLSASAPLPLSGTPNVYTNTFTVPNNAPIGADNVKAIVIDTEPLIGSAGTPFTVIAKPPTNALVLNQITGPTNAYYNTEATFTFNATNDSPDNFFPMNYVWFKNGVRVSTNGMGPNYTFLVSAADNGATIQCIANIIDPLYSNLTVTSGTITLAPQNGALVYTNGLKREFFAGANRLNVEIGNVAKGFITLTPNADFAGGSGNNYAERYSGYFIPPTNGNYVLFLAADDDTDLYLSTDSNPANKRLIAQEAGYSGTENWITVGGNGSTASQKRSDQWSPDPTNGVPAPYSAGFPLIGGNLYYIESVHGQGTGGDNWGVTYQTVESLAANPLVDGTPSLLEATNNNIATVTWPGTNIVWTQTLTPKSVFEGDTAVFTAIAVSDAEMIPIYTWYVNGVVAQSSPNGTNFSMSLVTLAQDQAQISVVAATEGLSITNGPVTLSVQRAVFEPGFAKDEKWNGLTSRTPIENGTAGSPTFSVAMPGFEQGADGSGTGQGDFAMRLSGFFIAPTNGNYVFFVSSDDDSDLFLSTDDTAVHKRLIAQEAGWSGTFSWLNAGGGGSSSAQKRSDSFLPSGVTTPPFQSGIPLVAGTKYYMEIDHHNGAPGGTHVGVTFKTDISAADPANGSLPKAIGNVIGINAVRCNFVGYTQQPVNATVGVGGYASFSVAGATDSQLPVASTLTGTEIRYTNNFLLYQWYKNGVAIPGATTPGLTVGPLGTNDSGTVISCQIRALGYADASFNPIWSNSAPATITVTGQSVFEPGYAQHDYWTNQPSLAALLSSSTGINPISTFVTPAFEGATSTAGHDNYVHKLSGYFVPPTNGNYSFIINSDDDSELFLSTDSSVTNKQLIAQEQVWSNPFQWNAAGGGGATAIAQKNSSTYSPDGISSPNAAGFPLLAGHKYYLEADQHNGGGGNNLEVTYYNQSTGNPPANGADTALSNNVIGFYAPRVPAMAFSQQPVGASVTSGGNSVTFSAAGNCPSPTLAFGPLADHTAYLNLPLPASQPVLYQWYKNGVAIPGATSSNYTQVPILPSDNGAQYVCGIRVLGYADNSLNPTWSNSVPAILTVVTDTVPPLLTYAATMVNSNQDPVLIVVDVTFNEWMDTATANNTLNYTVAGATVTKATLASNHRTVELVLDQAPTLPLNVTVNGVKDVSGNTIAANSTTPINPVQLTFKDIGNPGNAGTFGAGGIDPAYPSSIWVEGTNGFLVSAEGSDIFGTADGFDYGYELKTNDFDVVVRGVSNGHTSNFAKAGLMVREDLTAGSRNWSLVNDPASADGIQAADNSGFGANNVECNMRPTNTLGTISWKTNGNTVPAYPNAWLRMKRAGNVLTAYSSANGIDWVPLGAYDTGTNANGALVNPVYVGICVTAHNNDSATAVPPPPPFKFYNTAEFADYNSSFVATVRPRLTAGLVGTNTVISWTPAGGHLESSPALSGPGVNWQSLGTANPATNPVTPGNKFYRVVTP